MLFSSASFFLFFLPLTALLVLALGGRGYIRLAKLSLVLASLVFYGWWKWDYALLLLAIALSNYTLGSYLVRTFQDEASRSKRRLCIVLATALNLGLLGYFKYTLFVVGIINSVGGFELDFGKIVLPLGLSFITFQQIGFLLDTYSKPTERPALLDFALFTAFFPQVIAGPIIHHAEMIPQFSAKRAFRPDVKLVSAGLSFFTMGLAKKLLIADQFSEYVGAVYGSANIVGTLDAWLGVLAFTFQIYFDFSGYCDMALGAALIFGIHIPFNFSSPYKSSQITEYWQRWHATLTRFLTSYVYNPIVMRVTRRRIRAKKPIIRANGPNTMGAFVAIVAIPSLVTFFLSGIWHGAGFQFILWGVLHGLYVVVDHFWHLGNKRKAKSRLPGIVITFTAVLLSNVFFRADSVASAADLFTAMFSGPTVEGEFEASAPWIMLAISAVIVWALPNSQEVFQEALQDAETPDPVEPSRLQWRPTTMWAVVVAGLFYASLLWSAEPTEFLYFQF